MLSSLAGRLILLCVLLLTAALAASTIASLRAANANVTILVREELKVLEGVARFALERQGETLRERVDIVTADYALKEAMATQDRATALSALANHGDRLAADLALLLDREGEVLLSSVSAGALGDAVLRIMAGPARTGEPVLEVIDGKVVRIVARPVEAPQLIGWIVLGEVLDRQALQDLKTLTSADVSLQLRGDSERTLTISTLPQTAGQGDDALGTQSGWISRGITLQETPEGEITLLLSLSLADAIAAFDPLRLQLIAIGVVALLLAAGLSLAAARYLTRPIAAMVASARRISEGDYTHKVSVESGTELDHLGDALSFMQTTVAEREARIQYQAEHDLLTRLPNRNHLYKIHQQFLAENPPRSPFGILLLELEELQYLQDLYGAEFSDTILRETARRISNNLRAGDVAGRVGDRQILLFLHGLRPQLLGPVLQRIRREREEPLIVEGVPVTLELRLGVAFSPDHGLDFDGLQRRAQLALQAARQRGAEYAVYELGQDEKHLRQISIAGRIESALEENSFSLRYQPKYSLKEQRVGGVEALLRWNDRELGQVFPDEFIPIAEQTGVITALTSWVLDQGLRDLRRWLDAGRSLSMSINLSGVDVLDRDFLLQLMERVKQADIIESALTLEITETSMMEDLDAARRNLQRLSERGFRLSIDDYGTGFSSLGQLRSLPVSELKLDRSLVADIDTEVDDRPIVSSTIEMAHHLGLSVVAEGVETPAIATLLQGMHCDTIQGYLLAKPMTAEQLTTFLDNPVELEGLLIPEGPA